jgi:hypothetical protein
LRLTLLGGDYKQGTKHQAESPSSHNPLFVVVGIKERSTTEESYIYYHAYTGPGHKHQACM